MVLSPNMASGFPLTMYAGMHWDQRYTNLWPLVAAYDSAIEADGPIEYRTAQDMTHVERLTVEHFAEDIARTEPAVVIASRPAGDARQWDSWRLDPLKLLNRNEQFRAEFSAYSPAGSVGLYDVYLRNGRTSERMTVPVQSGAGVPEDAAPAQVRVRSGALPSGLLFFTLLLLIWRRRGRVDQVPHAA
jgi:hypothetical protein